MQDPFLTCSGRGRNCGRDDTIWSPLYRTPPQCKISEQEGGLTEGGFWSAPKIADKFSENEI